MNLCSTHPLIAVLLSLLGGANFGLQKLAYVQREPEVPGGTPIPL